MVDKVTLDPSIWPDLSSQETTPLIRELLAHQVELERQNVALGQALAEGQQAEAGLRRQHDFLEMLLETIPNPIFYKDTDGNYTGCNRAFEEFLDRSREEIIGKTVYDMGPPEIASIYATKDQELFDHPGRQRYEWQVARQDGQLREVIFDKATVLDGAGRLAGLVGVISDITERKRIEETKLFLGQRGYSGENFFEILARHLAMKLAMDYVCIDQLEGDGLTARTVAVYFDGQFEDNGVHSLKDTPCGEVLAQAICCFPQTVRHLFPQDLVLQEMGAESYAGITLWSSTGRPIGLIAVIGRRPMADPHLTETILKMVAGRAAGELERRQGEAQQAALLAALSEKTEELERFFSSALDLLCIADTNGCFRRLNREWENVLGYRLEELVGKCFLDLVHPDDLPATLVAVAELNQQKEVLNFTNRYLGQDGTYRWIEWRSFPHGKLIYATARDITERKQAEAERLRLERQLWQAHKAESLGRMAGAIAHHFNNLLGVVMGNLELAMAALAHGGEVSLSLAEAMRASQRAAEISRLMLAYLGQSTGQKDLLDLSVACRAALPLVNASLPTWVRLTTDWPKPGPLVQVDAAQLRQVLTNLVVNAAEAISQPDGAISLTIRVIGAAEMPAGRLYPPGWQPQAEHYACLVVADSGPGLTPEVEEKMFDPFFSTKFTGRGLGLPVALGMAKAHEGAIAVTGEAGRGAVFQVLLPIVAQAGPSSQGAAPVRAGLAVEPAVVLLVEDEPMVRKVAQGMLQKLGHTVIPAADGVEAVDRLAEQPDRIDCVLLDMTIPRLNGWETLAALRRKRADLVVILTSGYDEAQVIAEAASPEQPQMFLAKPYSLADLQTALAAALGQRTASRGNEPICNKKRSR